ncbi:MAG: ECF transporter S component [Oscillospiraceae bacterium]
MQKEHSSLTKRTAFECFLILILIPLTIGFSMAFLNDRKYYFTSLLIIIYTIIPFFIAFEGRKPKAREIVVISVLSAIAIVGRAVFFMVPQVKPVIAIVIIAGIAFGAESGFLVGAITGFVSNFFFGQGPWTPWQMFCFGIIGFLAGILFKKGMLKRTKFSLCIFGGLSTLIIYGGIINFGSLLISGAKPTAEALFAVYLAGLPMDLIHAFSTVIFLFLIAMPMLEKLDRIKVKYGLLE